MNRRLTNYVNSVIRISVLSNVMVDILDKIMHLYSIVSLTFSMKYVKVHNLMMENVHNQTFNK